MEKNDNYGAPIERGIIEKIENDGYIVASITRDGIKSLPIKAMNETDTFSTGEKVYFFLFPDGEGRILAKI